MNIERAAMISPRGDAKWLDCGNPGCENRVDHGKPATRSEAYCSTKCQKLCWKMHHKALCKDGDPPLQWLSSSRLFADQLRSTGVDTTF
eukprot:gene2124-19684_t